MFGVIVVTTSAHAKKHAVVEWGQRPVFFEKPAADDSKV